MLDFMKNQKRLKDQYAMCVGMMEIFLEDIKSRGIISDFDMTEHIVGDELRIEYFIKPQPCITNIELTLTV